jgi:copper chaperone
MKKYKVLNIKCGGCANTVKTKLEPVFGKVEVNLEVMPREITVEDSVDELQLREQLKSLGYPMADEKLSFSEEITTKANSFVSCAVGKINQ